MTTRNVDETIKETRALLGQTATSPWSVKRMVPQEVQQHVARLDLMENMSKQIAEEFHMVRRETKAEYQPRGLGWWRNIKLRKIDRHLKKNERDLEQVRQLRAALRDELASR